jgi:hypothetical protein
MPFYAYVDASGNQQQVEATDPNVAIANAHNIAKDSGVRLLAGGAPQQAPTAAPASNVPTPSPYSSLTSSSSQSRAGEASILDSLKNFNAGTQNYQDLLNGHLSYLDSYSQKLEAQRAQTIKSINDSAAQTKTDTENAQTRETGSTTVSLARIGGYLGGSASATGAMINLANTHRAELQTLEQKRQAAITLANQAIDDKQFDVAKQKVSEARNILNDIETSKQNFFNNNLKILQEQRSQDEALGNRYQDELKAFAYVDPKTIDPNKKSEIDNFYGVAGFTDKYLKATNDINKVKSSKDAMEYQKSFIDLLKDIPQGQKMTFPDGTTYTGIGSAGDISTVTATDDSGVVRQFMINKITGKVVGSVNLGKVGGSSNSSNSGDFKTQLQNAANALGAIIDPVTKRVSVNDYVALYKIFISQNPGQGSKFLQEFDPVIYTGKSAADLKVTP